MMAPASPTATDLPRVRLEVRTGSGRSVGYEVGAAEFLIGSAPGCDLRLPLPGLPPVAAQISVKPDGVRVRRAAPALDVQLNASPLSLQTASPLKNGDRLDIGEVEIHVAIQAGRFVAPKLVPVPQAAAPQEVPAVEVDLDRRETELAEREREYAEQAEELKADRVAWYRRKEELQQEFEKQQAELREARAKFEAERKNVFEDRSRNDKDAADRFRASRDEMDRQRKVLIADRQALDRGRETFEAQQVAESERLRQWEAVLAQRDSEFAERDMEFRRQRSQFDADRQQYTEDLVRLERKQAVYADLERDFASRQAELQVRIEQFTRNTADIEERSRTIAAEEERLRNEADRAALLKAELDARALDVAQKSAELESQQATLMAMRSRLERTREDAGREAAQLAQARVREEESQEQLRRRIREAEQLRAELDTVQENSVLERQRLYERDSLLSAGLEELRRQREALAEEDARVRERAADLDARMADFAEQAGALKGRLSLALDLQARLEADRVAIREREANLALAEEARQTLQDQVRRRAEELTNRGKAMDELARTIAAQKAAIDAADAEIASKRFECDADLAERRKAIEARAAEVEAQAKAYAEREASLTRQVGRLQDVGRAVAAERKALAESRSTWQAERATFLESDRAARAEADAFREQVSAEIETLRSQIPELDSQAKSALDRLHAAREMFRGHLTELHDYAQQTRDDLEAVRNSLREEGARLRTQEQELDRARAEHRLSITTFRQQLVEWKGKIAEIRHALSNSETRLEAREAAVTAAAKQVDSNSQQLATQSEQLRKERQAVAWKRSSVERHLSDMREWYRVKLRDLAHSDFGSRGPSAEDDPPSRPRLADLPQEEAQVDFEELDPGDLQLGELLLSAELVEAASLTELWAEAKRQRRTLRQVLLASGVITLYQLALIEAGNLDGLVLGRFRVIDRIRTSPQEQVYRVFDPTHVDGPTGGIFLLRHLTEAEVQDAVHPDEFRQRFSAARDVDHPNLSRVVEVLEIQGRPAALIEPTTGLPASELPPTAAQPGNWLKLMTMAAEGLMTAHRVGLVHGRLSSESFILTPDGTLVLTGAADPPWLDGSETAGEVTAASDLRALGQIAYVWSQSAVRKRGAKPFPEELAKIVRRLNADASPPMEDTIAGDRPFDSAAELVARLHDLVGEVPFSDDAWDKLVRHAAENIPDRPTMLRRTA